MSDTEFRLFEPESYDTSVVFASPHSGRSYPTSFLNRTILDRKAIRSSEDAYVDLLFSAVPSHGAPLLCALRPRAYLDLNRDATELDPAVIEGVRSKTQNPRVASGLGVVPRVVAQGRPIYRGKLSLLEARERIDRSWRPYHATLAGLMKNSRRRFGQAILIDCHSMPHEAVSSHFHSGRSNPDVVLGDRYGAAASPAIVDMVEQILTRAGLRVARNSPFAGAYIVQQYGRPSRNQHAIQLEINRSLYMDEKTIEPNEGFSTMRDILGRVAGEIAAIGRGENSLAAE